jgi:carboxypeptidase C (cathepsin A)
MKTVEHLRPRDFRVKTHAIEKVVPAYARFAGEMYAGLLPMDNGGRTGETMFWLFQPAFQSVKDTIVIWLNGGPVR